MSVSPLLLEYSPVGVSSGSLDYMSDPSLWKVLKSNFCFHILKGLLETAQFLSLSAAAHKLTNVKRKSSVFFCYTTLEKYFFLFLPPLSLVSLTLPEIFMLSSPVSQNRLDTCVCMCVYVILALTFMLKAKIVMSQATLPFLIA